MMIGGSPAFPRNYGPLGLFMYSAYTLSYSLSHVLLPMLLIWTLRRPVIRQQYEGTVSFC
jgi:hypothetical protein